MGRQCRSRESIKRLFSILFTECGRTPGSFKDEEERSETDVFGRVHLRYYPSKDTK